MSEEIYRTNKGLTAKGLEQNVKDLQEFINSGKSLFEYAKTTVSLKEEIHTDLTKQQAYKLMEQGHKIAHEYYADDEFLHMKQGVIYDEKGYRMGSKYDEFWTKYQKFETGWKTYN